MTKMSGAAKELKKQYMANWRKENKEKIRGYQAKYWENKVSELQEVK